MDRRKNKITVLKVRSYQAKLDASAVCLDLCPTVILPFCFVIYFVYCTIVPLIFLLSFIFQLFSLHFLLFLFTCKKFSLQLRYFPPPGGGGYFTKYRYSCSLYIR
jgi:hypothetical protein